MVVSVCTGAVVCLDIVLLLFSKLVIIPVEGIRLLDAVRLLLGRQMTPFLGQAKDAVPFAAVWC